MNHKEQLAEKILQKHIALLEDGNDHLQRFEEWKTYDFAKAVIAAIVEAMSLPPLCDDVLDDMDRDDLEVAYRKLRDSNSIYCKAAMDKHNEILELRRQVEAMEKPDSGERMCMSKLRSLINDYDKEEISISKFLEEINNSYKGWIPALKDSDYDGTYLGYIEKVEECGAINHYQRTVFNRMNKWVLTEGETLLYYMELPASPTKKDDDVASDSGKQ